MTIDERLEALTHSVELLASMQHETEERHRDLEQFVAKKFGELAESMRQLANIAAIQQDRLDDHEERLDKGGL